MVKLQDMVMVAPAGVVGIPETLEPDKQEEVVMAIDAILEILVIKELAVISGDPEIQEVLVVAEVNLAVAQEIDLEAEVAGVVGIILERLLEEEGFDLAKNQNQTINSNSILRY